MGERYARALAHFGEGDYSDPGMHERTLGDLLHPARPGRVVDVVNRVSMEVGGDVAEWRLVRVVSLFASLQREARERAQD